MSFLATPEAAQAWAELGGFSSANKKVDPSVYPDPILQQTAGAIAEAEVFRFDLSDLQPAAFGATVGQGMWKLFQDFLKTRVTSTGSRSKLEGAAKKAYGEVIGRTAGPIAAEPPAGSASPAKERGRWRGYALAAVFLAPALVFLGVWVVYPTIYTISRSFYGRSGSTTSSGSTTTTGSSRATSSSPRSRTTSSGSRSCRRSSPAIGLIFAVLMERIRWSVAFKTVVFMPMAISAFAAGITWRIMYEQDPDRGAVNAGIDAVHEAVAPAGVLADAAPRPTRSRGRRRPGSS